MKSRLTRKLLLIVAIPLTFELALFSTCAIMLNLAEGESSNESRTIRVMARMAPVLVSTVSGVTLTARALIKKQPIDKADYLAERASTKKEIKSFSQVAAEPEFAEYQLQIRTICDAAEKLNDCLSQVAAAITDKTESIRAMFDIRDYVAEIEHASQTIINDLKRNRRELAESDALMRRAFHFVLWSSIGLSLSVAAIGLIAFEALLSKPLKELMRLSNALAAGEMISADSTLQHSDDEIGDLGRSFESMAVELERRASIERAIFDNSADIICTLDSANRIQFINNAVEKRLGFQARHLIQHGIDILLAKDQANRVLNQLNEIRETRSFGSFESSLVKDNGIAFDVVWSVRWSSQDRQLYCCLYDIDFEKKTEQMAKNLRTIVVTELTQSLNEAKLAVGKISREEAKSKKKLELLDGNFSKIINLLKTLGDAISRESTDIPLSLQSTLAEKLLRDSIESVSFLAKQKSVSITLNNKELTSINIDASQIQRVLVNLLSNAIKASPEGATITVVAKHSDEQFVNFEVTDRGPGIPLNKQHLLFERFNQVGQLQSQEGKGSGLGLFSARQIVESHGGTIGVISDGQSGCTFRVTLPARQP